jgi:hypothetical protein
VSQLRSKIESLTALLAGNLDIPATVVAFPWVHEYILSILTLRRDSYVAGHGAKPVPAPVFCETSLKTALREESKHTYTAELSPMTNNVHYANLLVNTSTVLGSELRVNINRKS